MSIPAQRDMRCFRQVSRKEARTSADLCCLSRQGFPDDMQRESTSHRPPNRRLTVLRVAGQPDSNMKMRLVAQHNDEELVQLATRIPQDIARRLKELCVRKDIRMQSFVRNALVEKLTHSRRSARRQRSRG